MKTNHANLVNMIVVNEHYKADIKYTILTDSRYPTVDYYLITDNPADWNGENYRGKPSDAQGAIINHNSTSDEVTIYPVDDWDDEANYTRIGYSLQKPEYPQESINYLP